MYNNYARKYKHPTILLPVLKKTITNNYKIMRETLHSSIDAVWIFQIYSSATLYSELIIQSD